MKKFDIPEQYRSSLITAVKEARKKKDPRKKDAAPTILDLGPVRFHIARHFGFCYGVEHAIEIAYKALDEHPDRRIYLLSQMIHNPEVNDDLADKGMRFIMDTEGNRFIDLEELTSDDIVIIPAFGTTLEMEKELKDKQVGLLTYDTTCPFVTAVWKRAKQLGKDDHTIVIHGKPEHEETRATFSHSRQNAPSVIIKNLEETRLLGEFISGELPLSQFYGHFEGRTSNHFDPEKDLAKVGVVNQTTMLAAETQEIADHLKKVMTDTFGEENLKDHFADNKDTLCYATNDNQKATYALLEQQADLAIVVGGYNSSNTSHIVELLEEKFPTYFISSEREIESADRIHHFDILQQKRIATNHFLPEHKPVNIVLTSGASCPDSSVDKVLNRLLAFFENTQEPEILEEELT